MKVDLSSLGGNRRKRGRTPNHDKDILAGIVELNHGEGYPYIEATLFTENYSDEFQKSLPALLKKHANKDECESVFQNRWISRYRQRARSMWNSAGMNPDEFELAIFDNGNVYIARK